jgi:hypothetical protein
MSPRLSRGLLAAVLSLNLLVPSVLVPPAQAGAGLGTARGYRGVEISLDGGKSWMPIGARAFPLLDGAQMRTTSGVAALSLRDGGRIGMLPTSAVELRQSGSATEVTLRSGRLTFDLPRDTRVEIRTATARLEAVRSGAMAGEVFVGESNVVGVRMTQGTVQLRELGGERRTMLASLEPVFLPKRPPAAANAFSAPAPVAAPSGARGVYTPRGESLGYLGTDAQLVVHPGYTRDLTQPYPQRLVQVAMAKVPEADRKEAMPLFDVNGGYVGYLSNSGFYSATRVAQATQPQVAQAVGAQPALEEGTNWTLWTLGGAVVVVGGTVGGLAASGQFSGGNGTTSGGATAATPVSP